MKCSETKMNVSQYYFSIHTVFPHLRLLKFLSEVYLKQLSLIWYAEGTRELQKAVSDFPPQDPLKDREHRNDLGNQSDTWGCCNLKLSHRNAGKKTSLHSTDFSTRLATSLIKSKAVI